VIEANISHPVYINTNTFISFTDLVEVDVHALELELRSSVVHAIAIESVLAGNRLPVNLSVWRALGRHL